MRLRWVMRKRSPAVQRTTINPGCGLENSGDGGQCSDVDKGLVCKTVATGCLWVGSAHLRTLRERHHAKGRASLVAFAHQIEVTHLKDLQLQAAAGVEHRVQREQRQLRECEQIGHRAGRA